MYDHKKHDCQPTDDPAAQPNPPGDGTACESWPEVPIPELAPPEPCPERDKCCECPDDEDPPAPNCLESLLATKTASILNAEQSKQFQTELASLLETAKAGRASYTPDVYKDLVKDWVKQDEAIAELVRKLVCAVKCWKCILDCYVCPLLNNLHYTEKELYDDGKLYDTVNNLYDLEYWHTRNQDAKKRRFDRISSVLKAWGDPAGTIKAAMATNQGIYDAASAVIGTEPGTAIYPVFFQLIPLHLAIAPPSGSQWTTKIDKEFTDFCNCDTGTPDDCCGPDVGEWSLRQRLVGPQPYLIEPGQYFKLICCLVEKRYEPAMNDLSKATADLTAITARRADAEKKLKEGLENFAATAGGAIPKVIDCCEYDKDDDEDCDDNNAQAS